MLTIRVKISVELWRKVKSLAALRGEPVSVFVARALSEYVNSLA